jgi:hypothetical protein
VLILSNNLRLFNGNLNFLEDDFYLSRIIIFLRENKPFSLHSTPVKNSPITEEPALGKGRYSVYFVLIKIF